MVHKLQCVDVYNENAWSSVETLSQAKLGLSVEGDGGLWWPVYAAISNLPLDCALREHRYSNCSKLRVHPSTGKATSEQASVGERASADRPTCSLTLSSWVAYDFYHHCDTCKNYREGTGASTSLGYVYTLQGGAKLQFVIPPNCQHNFTFTEHKQLRTLRLPLVLTGGTGEIVRSLKKEPCDKESTAAVKSPIMVPSCGRHESGE